MSGGQIESTSAVGASSWPGGIDIHIEISLLAAEAPPVEVGSVVEDRQEPGLGSTLFGVPIAVGEQLRGNR